MKAKLKDWNEIWIKLVGELYILAFFYKQFYALEFTNIEKLWTKNRTSPW